jgi:hypothetical protein
MFGAKQVAAAMPENEIQRIIRDAIQKAGVELAPEHGSKSLPYDHLAADILSALKNAGFVIIKRR